MVNKKEKARKYYVNGTCIHKHKITKKRGISIHIYRYTCIYIDREVIKYLQPTLIMLDKISNDTIKRQSMRND